MKKWIAMLLAVLTLFALAACGAEPEPAGSEVKEALVVDYGDSELYTEAELQAAVDVIIAEFDSWESGTLLRLRYDNDEACTAENVAWLNQHEKADPAHPFTQCARFYSDFHTSPDAEGAFNQDADYTDWQWFLGRTEGGDWVLVDMGY